MMNEIEFDIWCCNNKIEKETKLLIQHIRKSPPARRVVSGKSNVSGTYCSRKMGVTIQTESHRVELPAAFAMEHDENVLEYYDQPPSIKLQYPSKSGRNVGFLYTPDFFVIRVNSAGYEEWKQEEDLIELSVKQPNRYQLDEHGCWRCPPGEQFADKYGLSFDVRSSNEINWVYQRNLLLLEDYFRSPYPLETKMVSDIQRVVSAKPGIVLQDISELIADINMDVLFAMIVNGDLYVDLSADDLAEFERITVFTTKDQANIYREFKAASEKESISYQAINMQIGETVQWDAAKWTIVNVGEANIALQSLEGKIISLPSETFEKLIHSGNIISAERRETSSTAKKIKERLDAASPEEIEDANERLHLLKEYMIGNPNNLKLPSDKTMSRWERRYREAEELWNCGYLGLLLNISNRGNRTQKLSPEVQKLIEESIITDYETITRKKKSTTYHTFAEKCRQQGLIPPTYKTYIKAVNSRPVAEQALKRQGRRAAYKSEVQYMELSQTTPRHGMRPFEIAHIDHTELDIELVSSRTGKNLGRPWVTFMMDAYSRRMIAVYLTFDPPSYRSCMMVIRECVKRFNRLPKTCVVDGGKEFQSVYFEKLMAQFEVNKKNRPPAKARFGSVCERLFGTSNTQFVHNLTGNTQNMKNVRQVTKSINPKTHAIWTFERFLEYLTEWAFEVYDILEHPALGMTPREAYERGMENFGYRTQCMIPYDENFRIATLPTTTKGTAKVEIGRGIKVHYLYYWADEFLNLTLENSQVPVRYDPFDVTVAYAYVNKKWVSCISEYYSQFKGYTERELQVITKEIRQQHAMSGKSFSLNGGVIARFISKVQRDEKYLEQQKKDISPQPTLQLVSKEPLVGPLDKKNNANQQSDFTDLSVYEEF